MHMVRVKRLAQRTPLLPSWQVSTICRVLLLKEVVRYVSPAEKKCWSSLGPKLPGVRSYWGFFEWKVVLMKARELVEVRAASGEAQQPGLPCGRYR